MKESSIIFPIYLVQIVIFNYNNYFIQFGKNNARPSIARRVLAQSNNLPIRSDLPVHSGKVRSVYWLTKQDSQRLIESNGYDVPIDSELAVMIITDRISAFECIWKGEGGMAGDARSASLNAISNHWFDLFRKRFS